MATTKRRKVEYSPKRAIVAIGTAFAFLFVAVFIIVWLLHVLNQIPTPPTPPSYYQGIVQGIGTGPHNNYVQFTSGTTLDGNVGNISNLSIGATCKLLLYPGSALLFINGTCER